MEIEGNKAAVYRDESGRLHVLAGLPARRLYRGLERGGADLGHCPCHGGRYAPTGGCCRPADRGA